MDDGPPFGKAGPDPPIIRESLAQPVQPLGHGFAGTARERLRAAVHLDAGNHALLRQKRHEGPSAGALLMDGFILQDDAADELLRAGRREEHVAVGAPRVLRGLEADRVEALLDRAVALVRRENALPVGDEGAGQPWVWITRPGTCLAGSMSHNSLRPMP